MDCYEKITECTYSKMKSQQENNTYNFIDDEQKFTYMPYVSKRRQTDPNKRPVPIENMFENIYENVFNRLLIEDPVGKTNASSQTNDPETEKENDNGEILFNNVIYDKNELEKSIEKNNDHESMKSTLNFKNSVQQSNVDICHTFKDKCNNKSIDVIDEFHEHDDEITSEDVSSIEIFSDYEDFSIITKDVISRILSEDFELNEINDADKDLKKNDDKNLDKNLNNDCNENILNIKNILIDNTILFALTNCKDFNSEDTSNDKFVVSKICKSYSEENDVISSSQISRDNNVLKNSMSCGNLNSDSLPDKFIYDELNDNHVIGIEFKNSDLFEIEKLDLIENNSSPSKDCTVEMELKNLNFNEKQKETLRENQNSSDTGSFTINDGENNSVDHLGSQGSEIINKNKNFQDSFVQFIVNGQFTNIRSKLMESIEHLPPTSAIILQHDKENFDGKLIMKPSKKTIRNKYKKGNLQDITNTLTSHEFIMNTDFKSPTKKIADGFKSYDKELNFNADYLSEVNDFNYEEMEKQFNKEILSMISLNETTNDFSDNFKLNASIDRLHNNFAVRDVMISGNDAVTSLMSEKRNNKNFMENKNNSKSIKRLNISDSCFDNESEVKKYKFDCDLEDTLYDFNENEFSHKGIRDDDSDLAMSPVSQGLESFSSPLLSLTDNLNTYEWTSPNKMPPLDLKTDDFLPYELSKTVQET